MTPVSEMKSTLLVVEDDELLRYVIVDSLLMLDMQVLACATADEAWLLLEGESVVDLVLTDIRMPGQLDGLSLAKLIWERYPEIPVILTSGDLNPLIGGMPPRSTFIAKPWTLEVMSLLVESKLSH